MERLERILFMLDNSISTNKRRHIAVGVLFSISLLFGGLAVTVISLKNRKPRRIREDLSRIRRIMMNKRLITKMISLLCSALGGICIMLGISNILR